MTRRESLIRDLDLPLPTTYPLVDTKLQIGGRAWTITAVADQDALLDTVQTDEDLARFPYGLLLWASSVTLANRLAEVPLEGKRVLELGAGAGLPGLIARWRGAGVTQTDYQEEALALARLNGAQNGIEGMDYLIGDWRDFPALAPFDLVIGSDILYERTLHAPLRALLPRLLAPGGTLLLADPIRPQAMDYAGDLGRHGWQVEIESRVIEWEGKPKETALFTARTAPPRAPGLPAAAPY